MKPFAFAEPATVAEAVAALGAGAARPISGGSDLIGELKEGTQHYPTLVSLGRIAGFGDISSGPEGLILGAGATIAQVEHTVGDPWRILAEAARGVATPEIRNQGTVGGNLCQRPRCFHYRSPWVNCLKKGGADCPAEGSAHQPYLAVMGATRCHAVNASDLAPPLLALEARVRIAGAEGEREVALAEFFVGPDAAVERENVLGAAEVVTAVVVPPPPEGWNGTYLKARERTAGDFPLVSATFGCATSGGATPGGAPSGGRIAHPRLVLGGVAPTPIRLPAVEALLEGQAPSPELAARAAEAAFANATPLPHNGYKINLGRALVARAITDVTQQS